jgi:hypothetical protein
MVVGGTCSNRCALNLARYVLDAPSRRRIPENLGLVAQQGNPLYQLACFFERK